MGSSEPDVPPSAAAMEIAGRISEGCEHSARVYCPHKCRVCTAREIDAAVKAERERVRWLLACAEQAYRILRDYPSEKWPQTHAEMRDVLRAALDTVPPLPQTQEAGPGIPAMLRVYRHHGGEANEYGLMGCPPECPDCAAAVTPPSVPSEEPRPHVCTYQCADVDCEAVVGPPPDEPLDAETALMETRQEKHELQRQLSEARLTVRKLEETHAMKDRALRTRDDYDFQCQDCGAPHNVDTSIPSAVWNAICENRPGITPGAAGIGMPEVGMLCTLCIDERLGKAGIRCDEAEFYFVGTNLSGKLYTESHGEVARLEREVADLEQRGAGLIQALTEIAAFTGDLGGFNVEAVRIAREALEGGTPTVCPDCGGRATERCGRPPFDPSRPPK